jgi:hypothetical protein
MRSDDGRHLPCRRGNGLGFSTSAQVETFSPHLARRIYELLSDNGRGGHAMWDPRAPPWPAPASRRCTVRIMAGGTLYLNVDLDIETADDPTPLAEALASSTMTLFCDRLDDGRWLLTLELLGNFATAEAAVARFVEVLSSLPEDARGRWRNAKRRSFNVGIEAATGPSWRTEFAPATLRMVAEHDAVLEFTIYCNATPALPANG